MDSAYEVRYRDPDDDPEGGPSLRTLHDRALEASELGVCLWFLGVHGGAGESTLAELLLGSGAAKHRWPVDPGGTPIRVVLVARTSHAGLTAVQAAMRDWYARHADRIDLLGLVLVASRPGRPAKQLRALQARVEHATRQTWLLPWVESWSLGEAPSPANTPKQVRALLRDLNVALTTTNPEGN